MREGTKKEFPKRTVLIIVAIIVVGFIVFLFAISKTQFGMRFGFFDKLRSLSFTNPFSQTGFVVSSVQNFSKTNPLRNFNPFDYINPFK